MKNTVQDKKSLSQPRPDGKRTFQKKWLIFSKPQLLKENGVGPRKTPLSTPNKEKYSSGQKTSFYT